MGTTTVRTLEYAVRNPVGFEVGEKSPLKQNQLGRATRGLSDAGIVAQSGEADIFIYPGFEFKVVGAMLTNFHLPKSTLLMLVSALAGHERVLSAYEHAVREKYRFYSYGDCMFVE